MAQTALATAFVNVVPSLKGFDSQLKGQLGGTMDAAGMDAGDKFNKGFGGTLSKIGGFITTALATGAVVNFTKSLIDAGEQEVAGNARLTQIAKSMGIFGDQADAVSQRLQDLSGVQQLSLGIDDDIIKSTQAKLLTFKELAASADSVGGNFDRATTAALDLAAAGFGSAESNAVQLGKALQDPIKGITALARAGVTFTDAEKERIKTLVESNKMGEAQNLVLKAIETQVGGTAAATATSSGKMEQAFSQLKENLGLLLLPAFNDFATYVTGTVVPAFQQFIQDFKDGKTPINDVVNAVTGLLGYVKDNWTWISTLGVAVLGAVTAFNGLKLAVETVQAVQVAYTAITTGITGVINLWKIATGQATLAQLGLNTAMLANPIGLVIAAIAAIIAALVYFFTQTDMGKKIWADFTKFIGDAWNYLTKWLTDAWNAAAKWLGDSLTAVGNFFKSVWDGIGKAVKAAVDFIVYMITNWSLPAVIAKVVGFIIQNWDKVPKFFQDSVKNIIDLFANAGQWLLDAGKNIIQGLIDGAGQMAGAIGKWISGLANTIMTTFKNLLGIKSPSRVFTEFGVFIGQGLVDGIESMHRPVEKAVGAIAQTVTDSMEQTAKAFDFTDLLNSRNAALKGFMETGISNTQARQLVDAGFGGPLQNALDQALGQYTFTNAKTGMSVTIGSGLDASVLSNMARDYAAQGYTQTSGQTIVYNAAPNNSLSAEQELIKAVKVARLV